MTSFSSIGLSDAVIHNLHKEGFEVPTPIQQQSIPIILKGSDILACAKTGTGKTAAFGLPILQLMLQENKHANQGIRCLILSPTRELAIQIHDSLVKFSKHLGIKTAVIFGGIPQQRQERELRNGCDILVSTPGRLLDLTGQGIIKLNQIKYLVLDEADRMLDMGFLRDIKKIIGLIPAKRQTLLFSATMPEAIRKFAETLQNNAIQVNADRTSSTVNEIDQRVCFVEKAQKRALLIKLVKLNGNNQCLVFTQTKHGANRLVKELLKDGITVDAIHGNKSQNARQKALANFKAGSINVLIATDIAARGIDIEELPLVINYDLPNVPETYVHRIGRTGRAGLNGNAVSFCDENEKPYLRAIEKLIQIKIPQSEYLLNNEPATNQKEVKTVSSPVGNNAEGSRNSGRRHGNRARIGQSTQYQNHRAVVNN